MIGVGNPNKVVFPLTVPGHLVSVGGNIALNIVGEPAEMLIDGI